MSHSGIPYYRKTQYGKDLDHCLPLFRGVQKTVLASSLGASLPGVRLPNPDLPDEYEMVGNWAGKTGAPAQKYAPEWQGLMKFSQYIRGVMRDKRAARKDVQSVRKEKEVQ